MGSAARRKRAYHEAGHALAAYFRHEAGRTSRLTIDPSDLAAENAGRAPAECALGVHYSRRALPVIVGRRVDDGALRANLAVYMAGYAAELRLAGRLNPLDPKIDAWPPRFLTGAAHDLADASDLAAAALKTYRNDLARELARGLAAGGKREEIVHRIAADQMRQLRDLIDAALRDAYTLVDSHWPAVRAVALALLRRGSLEGNEVRDLIEAAG